MTRMHRAATKIGCLLLGFAFARAVAFAQINARELNDVPQSSQSIHSVTPSPREIRQCAQFPGTDAGAKIAACIADLPPGGGTADARALEGAQVIGTPILIAGPVRLLLGAATYTMTGYGSIRIRDARGASIEGTGLGTILWASAFSEPAVLTIQNSQFVAVENLVIAGSVPEAVRLSNTPDGVYVNTQHQFRNVVIDGSSGNIQYGVRICGTDALNPNPCGDGSTDTNNDLHYFENVTIDKATVAGVEMIASNHKNITFMNSNIVESGIGVSVNPRGNFTWYSGSMALNTDSDFRIGTCNGEAISIYNLHSERSHRFLRGMDYDCLDQRVIIDGVSFGINPATFAADRRAISWSGAASLIIRGSAFGNQQENPTITPMELYWQSTNSAASLNLQNNVVQTPLENPFTGKTPTFSLSNIRLSGNPAAPTVTRLDDQLGGQSLQTILNGFDSPARTQ